MTNREAQMIKDKIDIALIALSHALEEPLAAEAYIHIVMDELEVCGRYVQERQAFRYYVKEVPDDETVH